MRANSHIAVTPVVAEASGVEVEGNEGDVRVVHSLELLHIASTERDETAEEKR